MADYLQKHPITDKQIQDEYNEVKQQQAGKLEYKVGYILVPDEKTANDLLAQIKGGKLKFEDAAKKNRRIPAVREKGGDLGWAPTTNYVALSLRPCDLAQEGRVGRQAGARTQYGWHIIKVEDTRPVEFRPGPGPSAAGRNAASATALPTTRNRCASKPKFNKRTAVRAAPSEAGAGKKPAIHHGGVFYRLS